MADLKISQLNSIVTVVPSTDVLPVVQGGTTLKITPNQILGSGGTATLASATITGDLTVRSANKLILNRADNAVSTQLNDQGSGIGFVLNNVNGDGILFKVASNSVYSVGSSYTQTWFDGAGGTRMTLNSTGLGVGGSPVTSHLISAQGPIAFGGTAGGTRTSYISNSAAGSIYYTDGGASYPFDNFGNLVIQPRTSAGRSVIIATSSAAGTPVERLIVDPTGNVGVGVAPSSTIYSVSETRFVVKGTSNNYAGTLAVQSKGTTNAVTGFITAGDNTNEVAMGSTTNSPLNFYTNNAYKASIDASGRLLVGKTATSATTVGVELQPDGNVWATKAGSTSATTAWDTYSTGAAAYRFYVSMNGTVNATNTVISAISDVRFKENIQDIDVGLAAILSLKPRKFDWKAGKGKDIKGDRGFIAQEFETVFPNLIDEWKDPAPEGEAPYKSVRQDLIPVLVKAIQELTARVQTLEAR